MLEYGRRGEGGGMYAEGWWLPLTLNYFPFRSIFPTLKTLSASERGSIDLQKIPTNDNSTIQGTRLRCRVVDKAGMAKDLEIYVILQ